MENNDKRLLLVGTSPHILTNDDTRTIMADVLIALVPALAAAVYFFGLRSLTLTLVSCASCVVFEFLYQYLMKRPIAVGDLSAVVTGVLWSLCCRLRCLIGWW